VAATRFAGVGRASKFCVALWENTPFFASGSMVIDLKLFNDTPLTGEPFQFLVVPGFVKPEAREAINRDYPAISKPGSFPLSEVSFGPAFRELVDALNSNAMRKEFEDKFRIDLTGRPSMITVRGRCSERDGKIHTDSKTKIITVLLYMNPGWEESGGRLRLLRSGTDLDDVILEVPPVEGTLLAFKRADNSWHGHKPFAGPRRVLQFNWVTSGEVVHREQNRHRVSAFFKNLFGISKAY
jgi:SM-20-related protein